MFEKCITCKRIGESCVPNLWLLSFPDLIQWNLKRIKYLGWTTQYWADKSNVPVGTVNRIKAGDYADCKYSTIRNLSLSAIGGTTDEFACTEQVENELRHLEQLEQQAAKLSVVEAENELLKNRFKEIDEVHRNDIRAIKCDYQEQIVFLKDQIAFLKEELKAWQEAHRPKKTTK